MTTVTVPFIETNLKVKISLEPAELNNEILSNLKSKVKQLEKKCSSKGYINKVYSINNYSTGIINPENLMCAATFNVNFYCQLYNPQINTYIICKILKVDNNMISCENGPIIVIVQTNKINPTLKESKLDVNDYVKVKVLQKRFFPNDNHIKVLGYIEDKASDDDINNFF